MSMPAEHLINTPTLKTLLDGIVDAPAVPLTGMASDTRSVQAGYVFLACPGQQSHGADYIAQAIDAGAVAVIFDATTASPAATDVPMVGVEDLPSKIGQLTNRFYADPSSVVRVVGVTGTNGKTTVSWLAAQCLARLGHRCGYIGTLGSGIDEISESARLTTPDAVSLQSRLAEFRDQAASFTSMEVSSHALDQNRVAGVSFDTVMFTNLSRDHLDYHGSMQAYGDAKARLFTETPALRRIINLDSEFGLQLASRCGQDVITVSTNFDRVANGRPYVFVRKVVATEDGSQISAATSWGDAELLLPLVGDFNVANSVMVLALMLSLGVPLADAAAVLADAEAPPGRMQRVPGPGPATYVDYAHTPDALELALRAIRAHCRGRLWVVFGCGGDRDRGKRPQMARAAERRADRVVVTNDNPRTESPTAIINDILEGFKQPDDVTVIEDRGAAIAWALREAGEKDVVLIAGKGHEDYQIIGEERLDFSDVAAASANLARQAGGDA